MKIKFMLTGGLLVLLVGLAAADINIAAYQVDGFAADSLEQGATWRVTVSYSGGSQTIVGAKFYLDYNNTFVDNISESNITDNLASGLTSKTNPNFTPANGQIRYQRDAAGGSGFALTSGAALFSVTFHVRQTAAIGPQPILLQWLTPIADNVKLTIAGGTNVAGSVNNFQTATIVAGAAPTFGGLNTVSDPQTGNTLNLDWTTNGNAASDLNSGGGATYYAGHNGAHNGQGLRYNIRRDGVQIAGAYNGFTYSNSGLNDNQAYDFIVRAQDACTPTPNEEQNTTTVSGTPRDYTAPDTPAVNPPSAGDGTVTLSWTTSGLDVTGVIIVRKPDGTDPNPTLVSANGAANGTTYDTGDTLSDGSVVIYRGTASPQTDSGLTNGASYIYKIYAFDPVGGTPVQQGNNYSTPATVTGIPGVAPANVTNLRALSDPNTGDITLRWANPAVGYGGARLVYTTDFSNWGSITPTSADSTPASYTAVETASSTEDARTISGLNTSEVYYFRVFSFNPTPTPATRAYASGVPVAALPLRGTGGAGVVISTVEVQVIVGTTQEVTVALKKKASGFGVNSLVIPFSPVYDEAGTTIATLANLINKINSAAGKGEKETVVSTLGYWDSDEQQAVGFAFNDDGSVNSKQGTTQTPADIALLPNVGYQIYVKETVPSFKLKSTP